MGAFDQLDKWTDEQLAQIERRIRGIYSAAADELAEKAAAFYRDLEDRDMAMRARVEDGTLSGEAYRQWLQGQMAAGERYEAMRDELAARVSGSNQLAATYISGSVPEIFRENYNRSAWLLERGYGDLSFTLFDEHTVRRLILERPELLPPVSIDIPLDERWNQGKITDVITSAILQGKRIPDIAQDLRLVAEMNRVSAVRNARTAVTGAQNAGRQESYNHAAAMGITVRKMWVATKDSRTRDSHRAMDGTVVPYDEAFHTDLGSTMMYPGDRNGKPGDVYNCRCTMRTVEKAGIEAEPRQMRVRDPATGKNVVVSAMTYPEWERWKGTQSKTAGIGLQFFAKADPRKLTEYALVPGKSKGKAEAFRSALGYTAENAEDLRKDVLEHFDVDKLRAKGYNGYGDTFELVMKLKGPNGRTANVLTSWILEDGANEHKLTSIYITDKEADV